MDKRILAIVLAVIMAVPAAVCVAQYDSEAADDYVGSTKANPIELGTITVNVDGTMNVGLKNNETAYMSYDSYTMSFTAGTSTDTINATLGSFGTKDNPEADAANFTDATIKLEREGTDKIGAFNLTVTGAQATDSDGIAVYIKCAIEVTEDGNTVSDEIYYKLAIVVIEADGIINFTSGPVKLVAGELVDVELIYDSPSGITIDKVYAKGLPAGLNIVYSDSEDKLKITVWRTFPPRTLPTSPW